MPSSLWKTFAHGTPKADLTDLEDPSYGDESELRLNYQKLSDMRQAFAKRWLNDYVNSLRERHQYYNSQENRSPKVGDLILLVLDDRPREDYPLGIIVEAYKGEDGIVRTVKVKTALREYTRPIVKVIPLELQVSPSYFTDPAIALEPATRSSEDLHDPSRSLPNTSKPATSESSRPKRSAAIAAREKIREQAED